MSNFVGATNTSLNALCFVFVTYIMVLIKGMRKRKLYRELTFRWSEYSLKSFLVCNYIVTRVLNLIVTPLTERYNLCKLRIRHHSWENAVPFVNFDESMPIEKSNNIISPSHAWNLFKSTKFDNWNTDFSRINYVSFKMFLFL